MSEFTATDDTNTDTPTDDTAAPISTDDLYTEGSR